MYRSISVPDPETSDFVIKHTTKLICVFDCETDPFSTIQQSIAPFTCGFYDGHIYVDFWGDDCIDQFAQYIYNRAEHNPDENLLIYAHNLGGFDIHFLYKYFDNECRPGVINGRIYKAYICGHEWRDSYKILPVALSAFGEKYVFDYELMKKGVREKHKNKILEYQMQDCIALHKPIILFHDMFGDQITIGSCSIKVFQSFHGFERMRDKQDERARGYFKGGAVRCFQTGVIKGDWKVYDVNSMYPHVMANFSHPISAGIHAGRRITENTAFVTVEGWNKGGLPQRGAMGELNFPDGLGMFKVSIHELNAAVECGYFKIKRVIETLDFSTWADFKGYINHYYDLRMEAKKNGDAFMTMFYKFLLNNAYGKFAQDPRKYGDYIILEGDYPPEEGEYNAETNPNGWSPKFVNTDTFGTIWERKSKGPKRFFNVATGASITGAARAVLLRGIYNSVRPIYCDTDSIICEQLNADLDDTRLGAWKLEATGTEICVAGKKMYALFDGDKEVKKASKGVGLTAAQIREVAAGSEIVYRAERPTFSLGGGQVYTDRTIKVTA